MVGTFEQRTVELGQRVGYGNLVGVLRRDQRYAAVQERDPTLKHPRGGQWKYQETALYAMHRAALARVAATVLGPQGPAAGMADGMELVDDMASGLAPRETTALARSGSVRVDDDGRRIRYRPPEVPRLSDAQLRADRRGRRRGGRRGR